MKMSNKMKHVLVFAIGIITGIIGAKMYEKYTTSAETEAGYNECESVEAEYIDNVCNESSEEKPIIQFRYNPASGMFVTKDDCAIDDKYLKILFGDEYERVMSIVKSKDNKANDVVDVELEDSLYKFVIDDPTEDEIPEEPGPEFWDRIHFVWEQSTKTMTCVEDDDTIDKEDWEVIVGKDLPAFKKFINDPANVGELDTEFVNYETKEVICVDVIE